MLATGYEQWALPEAYKDVPRCDKPVDLPCCGVFEMQDGKIKVWRDYFDMGTYVQALSR